MLLLFRRAFSPSVARSGLEKPMDLSAAASPSRLSGNEPSGLSAATGAASYSRPPADGAAACEYSPRRMNLLHRPAALSRNGS